MEDWLFIGITGAAFGFLLGFMAGRLYKSVEKEINDEEFVRWPKS